MTSSSLPHMRLSVTSTLEFYLLADAVRGQLVVMHHEPHEAGAIVQSWVRHSCDGVVLEVQVFHMGGDSRHGCQAPPIAIHGHGKCWWAITLFGARPPWAARLQGSILIALAPGAVQPGEGVGLMAEWDRKQDGQDEDYQHSHGGQVDSQIFSKIWEKMQKIHIRVSL